MTEYFTILNVMFNVIIFCARSFSSNLLYFSLHHMTEDSTYLICKFNVIIIFTHSDQGASETF